MQENEVVEKEIEKGEGILGTLILFSLKNKFIIYILLLLIALAGLYVLPFNFDIGLPRNPVPVDAIPDIGENQQIVFSNWQGRSPQDVEDQITYPLTVSLLGIPGVKTVRSYSFFGFSNVYVIFEDGVDFYWGRARILEKLSSAKQELPDEVNPVLGPDATALGQIFWYTLEGKGFSLQELRSIQDWQVKYALASAKGVSEVASIGGYVKEYQVDVNPNSLKAYGVSLEQIVNAVRNANIDVGAKTIEINRVEYFVRGVGFVKKIEDLENIVIAENDNTPIYLKNVANVALGPAMRRGVLDKEGAEVVGGVVVVRYGENPLEVIQNVKDKINEISKGLPTKKLNNDEISQVKIVPFYDRTTLINETLDTLDSALINQVLITVIVVLIMVMNIRSTVLISGMLPLAVFITFIAMKVAGVDSNIMSLSGIVIAIGTIVDMGIIMTENVLRHLDSADPAENRLNVIYRGAKEVSGAVLTAISTTVIAFLPVFVMSGAEGKLFKPLAFTKTFALIASVLVAIIILPPFLHLLFGGKVKSRNFKHALNFLLIITGALISFFASWWVGLIVGFIGIYRLIDTLLPKKIMLVAKIVTSIFLSVLVAIALTKLWMPLGYDNSFNKNLSFVIIIIAFVLGLFRFFQFIYVPLLRFFLRNKLIFYVLPIIVVVFGAYVWIGPESILGKLPGIDEIEKSKIENIHSLTTIERFKEEVVESDKTKDNSLSARIKRQLKKDWKGRKKEFMPPLDEGSFLLMPTTMVHASLGEALDILQKQDIAISAIPEVESVVGKIGRVESALDPAPISMIETVINYKPEYGPIDPITGKRERLWRDKIKSPDDIWKEIVSAAKIPGTTSAPKLQPIATRIVMLQSGMRAPIGVKVYGPTLDIVEKTGLEIEKHLRQVESINSATVNAERIVGKPYLEIHIDRNAIARYGISIRKVQNIIEVAIGGKSVTKSIEGRERYSIRVRYQRELRDNIDSIERILVTTPSGAQIPLTQLSEIRYVRGPQVIKSEDTRLVGYIVFDKKNGYSEIDAVNESQDYLDKKIASGELKIPAGVSYKFAGNYENQIRSEKTLMVVIPVSLMIIFVILYLNFKSVTTSFLVFFGIAVAWSGGFILIWLYSQSWFLDSELLGTSLRTLFQIGEINLSVAVWVGFLALFGIATDDGVVIGSKLKQEFDGKTNEIESVKDIHELTIMAGKKRIRACLMTTATTILALLPVLTSTGRGSDVMIPMAIPSFGGMLIALLTLFVVPVSFSLVQEIKFKLKEAKTK